MIDPLSGNSFASTQALSGAASGPAAQTSVLATVADLLGMSSDDLVAALRNGSSMSDLASQKGISRDDLLAAITQGLQSSATAAGPSGSAEANTVAARIADRRGSGGHHHHHHGGGSQAADLQQNVTDLAASLGISTDQVVQALQTGLTGTGGTSGYGVSGSLLQGLQFDQLA
jgi:hypothetical protein